MIYQKPDEAWKAITDDYKLLEFLGKGSYGQVYKAKRLLDNQIVAIKLMKNTF